MTTATKEFNAKHGVLAGTSSTNHLKFSGSTTGNPVTICAQGYDEDISIYLYPKGNGIVNFPATTTASVALTNDNSTNATFYPTFSTTSSGTVTGLNASSAKLSFNPSSGMLCSTQFNGMCVGLGNGNISTNIAVGYQSLCSNTTGSSNTANGHRALYSNTTGFNNTAIGYNAGCSITTGTGNIIIGSNAGSAGLTCCIILSDGAGTNKFNITSTGSVCVPTSVSSTTTTSGSLIIAGGTGIGENLTVGGAVQVGPSTIVFSKTYTTSTTAEVTIDSFSASDYRTAIYEVQMTSSTNYHTTSLKAIHNGTTVYLTQYGEIFTNSSLGSFDASISSGTLNLLFTPTNAVTAVKLTRQVLVV